MKLHLTGENAILNGGRLGGCKFGNDFYHGGETWYSKKCKRHKCIQFNGDYFVETDS